MLQTAKEEAKALPGPTRAYLLLEIASSYIAINSAKERGLRLQAFQATLAIEDDDATKEFLQWEILQELLINSETDLEKGLAQRHARPSKYIIPLNFGTICQDTSLRPSPETDASKRRQRASFPIRRPLP